MESLPIDQERADHRKALVIALGLNAGYMVIEAIGGILTGSMALLSDALHMLTDVGAISMALFASWLAQRPKDSRRTFGYLRAEIIGAMLNGVLLILLCGYILFEAYQRIGIPVEIEGGWVLLIATIGLAINLISARLLHKVGHGNLNIEGAYTHMMLDALGSVGAMVSGAVILFTGWTLIDPLASVFIALLVLRGGWRLLVNSIDILMESAPPEMDYDEITSVMLEQEHLVDLHDLHIWAISSGVLALSAHIQVTDDCISDGHWPDCLKETQDLLRNRWGIEHTTLQTEPKSYRGDHVSET